VCVTRRAGSSWSCTNRGPVIDTIAATTDAWRSSRSGLLQVRGAGLRSSGHRPLVEPLTTDSDRVPVETRRRSTHAALTLELRVRIFARR